MSRAVERACDLCFVVICVVYFLFDVRRVLGLLSFVAFVCTVNFEVLLTVRLSIILAIDQLNAQILVFF